MRSGLVIKRSFIRQTLQILSIYACLTLVCAVPVFALDRDQSLSQLYHTSWTARDGVNGSVVAIAQTSDGYLWVGTTDGLLRFDGVSFERYKPEVGSFFSSSVSALLALPDGGLWIGYLRGGASFLKNGRVTNYSERDGFPLAQVRSFAQDWDGTMWVAAVGGLSRLEGNHWRKVRMDWGFPGGAAWTVFTDNQGTIWVGSSNFIMFLPKGEKKFHDSGIRVNFQVPAFIQRGDGTMSFVDGDHYLIQPFRLRPKHEMERSDHASNTSNYILVDRDGTCWMAGTAGGIFRVRYPNWTETMPFGKSGPGVDSFTREQGLTDERSSTVFEDREGNVWVGTRDGLDLFRRRNLIQHKLPPGSRGFSLVAAESGDIWVGQRFGELLRVRDGKPVTGGPPSVLAVYRDRDEILWFSSSGMFWRYEHGKFVNIAPPKQVKVSLSKAKDPLLVTSITRDSLGVLWVSIAGFGEFQLKDGLWKFTEVVKGHSDWAARSAFTDSHDRLWLVFGEIVTSLDHGQVQIFSKKEGLTIGAPNIVDGRGEQVWVGGESGVAVLAGNRFRVIMGADGNDFGLITGIVATSDDGLWLAAGPGIVHIPEHEIQSALQRPDYKVTYELFDLISDLPEPLQRLPIYSSGVIQSKNGMLWFATQNGVAQIDPAHITKNPLPPPVMIKAVIADEKPYSVFRYITLPPLTKNLEIDYTALSLSIPERVQFRYKLEGADKGWQNIGPRRQAFFRDLRPGKYKFHVIASNNDGVWNQEGAILNFSVAPAWYQTIWFKSILLVIGLGIAIVAYLFDRRRYAVSLRIRFNERLEERTRLARDLHDTLLQTLEGSRLVADGIEDALDDPVKTRSTVQRLTQWLERATIEGRAALDSLRYSTSDAEDLATSLRRFAENCPGHSMRITFSEKGIPRSMLPIARAEVFRIGVEAIRNACIHSGGTVLNIEVRYGINLILSIRDNGSGFDPALLNKSKPGHFGIVGMRERAIHIGSRLSLESSPGSGTCLTLRVPGKVIYRSSSIEWFKNLLRSRRR